VSNIDISNIEGVKLVSARTSTDFRGSFVKFDSEKFLSEELGNVAVSINPRVGTIRGLHFQVEPYAEEKIVSCIQGSAFEVVVDLRPNSKSFGEYATFELSQKNVTQVYLPKGIAHGFQTLSPDTILHYFLTSEYSLESSYTINPFGDLNIKWPVQEFSISEKDAGGVSMEYAAKKFAESQDI
jgi:dTDP-4-dehydrorhamnose 3,5-epimerase